MPHLILDRAVDPRRVLEELPREVRRWRTAVLKTTEVWSRSDRAALLVEGVVVEHSRPLHPVALVGLGGKETSVRLWDPAPIERTPAVQRWLALVAADLRGLGAGDLRTSNIAAEILEDLELGAPR
jgi:hypothetical protein